MGTLEIKKQSESELFKIPGVVGVGLVSSGITVYIEKFSLSLVNTIPAHINGIPVIIVESGKFEAFRTTKWRPAPGGVYISNPKVTAGTVRWNVFENKTGRRVILSNNHVLTNKDTINNSRANVDEEIYQPGTADGGNSADTIATLTRWVKIDEVGDNLVDAAIATPINDADLRDDILEVGNLAGTATATESMSIKKSGRTTALTTGTVMDANLTSSINYGAFTTTFTDQILSSDGMGAGGDSGSAVLTTDNRIVGLLFAGNSGPEYIIANKIDHVMKSLDICITPSCTITGTGYLGGRITDSLAAPLQNVMVLLENGIFAFTDTNGDYSIRTPIGLRTASVYISNVKFDEQTITINPDQTTTLNRSFDVGMINGAVKDTVNNPLSGVNISVNGGSATTDGSGNYSIPILPGSYEIIATKQGYNPEESSISIAANETKVNNFIFEMYTDAVLSPMGVLML